MPVMERPDTEQIFANIPVPVLLLDSHSRIMRANGAAEDFFGRSCKMLERAASHEILRFSDDRIGILLEEAEGDVSAQDTGIHTVNGLKNADIFVTSPIENGDWRMIMISPRNPRRDHIGDHDDNGSQQAMGAPAILGHEIKNPLAGIKGAAQLLAKRVDEDAKPLTGLIVNEVDRIARLLDQMQNLGNNMPSNPAPANIHLVIERAIRSIRAANKAMPELTINYDPSLPDVMIDEDAMVQIIINLLQNAVDCLDNKSDSVIGITTRFVLGGELRDSGEAKKSIKLPVEISISDNGPGVAEHIEKELFSPFVTSKRDGQGLGLAIVRKLINQMNSRIVYERDNAKEQTHFRLFLPVATGNKS